ncbi:MAG: YciI family protein [Kofleriaceae bacterium]
MRVMVIVKASNDSEAGIFPSTQLLDEMTKYNDQLVKAGIMLAGDGLKPSSAGKRIQLSGNQRSVTDGPFSATTELVAGYWIWQVKSIDEAVEWAKRCPSPMPGEQAELEIRPLYDVADFGDAVTPEIAARVSKQQAALEKRS